MRTLTSYSGLLGGFLLLTLGILMLIGVLDFVVRIGGLLCIVIAVVILLKAFTPRKGI